MTVRSKASWAALGASTIYALNHTIAKGVMPTYVQGFGFTMIRLIGATILFWGVSCWIPAQKIQLSDVPRMILCAILGMGINMLSFFKGLEYSTPINSSILISTSPILVFIFSAILLKEKLIYTKIFGVVFGFFGSVIMIVFSNEIRIDAPNIALGNFLFIVNSAAYGLYLILVRPLVKKYHFIHLLKWLFLIGLLLDFPFTYPEFSQIQWDSIPIHAMWNILFVVIGTTFMTYLLNAYALQNLKASTLGVFIYLQPILGVLFAIFMGADQLSLIKTMGALIVFGGVYLVTKPTQKTKIL